MIHPEHSPDQSVHAAEHAHVNVVRIELGKETLVIVIVLLIVLSGCGLIMGLNLAKQARQDQDFKDLKTQEWLVERRLMDREALDILHGIKQPGDDQWGATGNMQRMKPKEK
jgi:uncharacterized protein YceK